MAALKKALMAASAKAVRTQLATKAVVSNNRGPTAYILFGKDERPKLTAGASALTLSGRSSPAPSTTCTTRSPSSRSAASTP